MGEAACAATFSIPVKLARRCVEQRIRDRWVCCAFESAARSCVKMKGDATWRDERREKHALPASLLRLLNGRFDRLQPDAIAETTTGSIESVALLFFFASQIIYSVCVYSHYIQKSPTRLSKVHRIAILPELFANRILSILFYTSLVLSGTYFL